MGGSVYVSTGGSILISGEVKSFFKTNESELLVFLLIVFSGNPAICAHIYFEKITIIFALCLLLYSFYRNSIIVNRDFIKVSLVFAGILLIQTLSFSFFPFYTISGFYFRLYIAFAILVSIKKFPDVFISVMVKLSVISLLLHLLWVSGLDLPLLFKPISDIFDVDISRRQASFIHTFFFDDVDKYRNAGMFWEPGAFSGYLILAMIMLSLIKNQVDKKRFIVTFSILIITLLSTRSSMGYICLPFAVLLNVDFKQVKIKSVISGKLVLLVYVALPLILIIAIYGYNHFDFLKKKMTSRISITQSRGDRWEITRFGTLLFDLQYITKRPLTGWGPNPMTRYSLTPWMIGQKMGMGNGMSDFTVKYGLIGLFTFLLLIFKNFNYYYNNRFVTGMAVFTILLTLQGENFLGYPLYCGLMFLNAGEKNTKIRRVITW